MNDDDVWRAVDTERATLHDLLAELPAPQWRHPSLCDRWQVRDVVAHLVFAVTARPGRVVVDLVRARGALHRMVADTAIRHAARRTPDQLLTEFRGTIGSRFAIAGTRPTDRLWDIMVHGQDIAVPLGLHREIPSDAALLAIDWVWRKRFKSSGAARLAGYRLRATDADWERGDGPVIEGPVSALLLLATGRTTAAVPDLRGPGLDRLLDPR